jgi:hypothetical protein
MAELTEKELAFLSKEIDKQGLTYTQLQKELLDHLCCDIEARMDEGIEFLTAFEEVSQRLENDRIQQIQEETLLLINQKYRMMKRFMYILGTIAPTLLIVGALFKLMHWPGASVLLTLGTFLLAVIYLPVFAMYNIRDTRKQGRKVNKALYITGVITGFFFLTGVLFKVNHWPGAGVALSFSVLFTVVVFIPVLVTHAIRDKENQLQNFSILIFILALMAVNIMVLGLRISKNALSSMIMASEQHLITSRALESGNALYLEQYLRNGEAPPIKREMASLIHEKSNEMDRQLEVLMGEILVATTVENSPAVGADGDIDISKAKVFDMQNGVYRVMITDDEHAGQGEALQNSLEIYRELLLSNASPELQPTIRKLLDIGPVGDESWLGYHFYMVPMIGAINVLSNLQLNIRFLEGEVLREISADATASAI